MIDAYGYVRCSGLGQMDGEGPDRQQDTIGTFASSHGYNIARWYIESHTGKDLEGRPDFGAMRASIVSNGVRCVIVERLDRLARSVLIQETIIADFKENGILLISATPGEEDLCGDDPTRVLIRQILAAFFEYERKMIQSKLADARTRVRIKDGIAKGYEGEEALKHGRCEGRRPFGEDPDRPEEPSILQQMTLLSELMSPQEIARQLNQQGLKTRYGKQWTATTVSRILARHQNSKIAA